MRNQMLAGIILTIIVIAFIGVYWAYEPERQIAAQQKQFDTEMRLGARTYALQCAKCHGATGDGLAAPPQNDNQLPEEIIKKIIERGIPHSSMTAWSFEEGGALKEHEISNVAAFISNWDGDILDTVRLELSRESADGDESDADEFSSIGEKLFTSKGCATCHGDDALGRVLKPGDSCLSCHTGPIRSLELAPLLPGHSEEIIREKVRGGGKKMPAFDEEKITEDELLEIIDFIEEIPVPEVSGDLAAALSEALEAVRNEEIFWAMLQLEEALIVAEIDVQKARIEKILEDVVDGNLSEAAEQLEALVTGEVDHRHEH
jgi:mono/diheme cytochrome c family protein